MTRSKKQLGFTIVELMLAMAFLGSVMVLVTSVLVQSLNIYNKGVAIKQINQISRSLVEDVVRVGSSSDKDVSVGVSCMQIGSSVYVWNPSGQNGYITETYKYEGDGKPVNFIRVEGVSDCSTVPTNIPYKVATALVGDQVRIYNVEVEPIPGHDLVNFKIVLGTYGSNNLSNPRPNGNSFECPTDGLGNFCSLGTIETVLYLPGGSS